MTNTFTWTSDQEFIFSETIENPKSSFIIDSCAGASKTTTLTEMVNRMVAQGVTPASRVLCLAFNKKTAEALQDRMPPGTVCSTLNAFGHRALMSFLPVRR